MTTSSEHTFGFYLTMRHHILRDMQNNREACNHAKSLKTTNILMLSLLSKYQSENKQSSKITETIKYNQNRCDMLNSEFSVLQSELDTLNSYLRNNDDIAARAYDAAYDCDAETKAYGKTPRFLKRITKLFSQNIK